MKRSKLAAGQGIGLILVSLEEPGAGGSVTSHSHLFWLLAWQPCHHPGDLEELPLASAVLCIPHVGGNIKLPLVLPRETEARTQHTLGLHSRLLCACGRGVI